MAGAPYLPHFRIVNARNIRAVFHRYNAKHNKGCMPGADEAPSQAADQEGSQPSVSHPEASFSASKGKEPSADDAADKDDDEAYSADHDFDDDCGCGEAEHEVPSARPAAGLSRGEDDAESAAARYKDHCLGPDIWGSCHRRPTCCCQFRSFGTMEL